jgi:hypothetical protein
MEPSPFRADRSAVDGSMKTERPPGNPAARAMSATNKKKKEEKKHEHP